MTNDSQPHQVQPNPVVPNLFVIGAPKCGTSALCVYLADRPDVFMTDPKEPFFLCFDYPHLKAQHFLTDQDSYLKLYEEADPAVHAIIAEGSTNYLRSQVAVAEALKLNPDAKFVAMLRNPIDVAHAFHMEQLFARNEDVEDFETAWNLQETRAQGQKIPEACRAPEFLQYRAIAMMGEQLSRFHAQVPEENRLVLFQEDMRASTRDIYVRTLEFLGLPDDGRTDFASVNSSHQHRYEWVANLVLSPPRPLQGPMWAMRGWLRRNKPAPVEKIKKYLRVKGERSPISPELRARMAADFAPDVALIEQLTGRDLSHWLAPKAKAA